MTLLFWNTGKIIHQILQAISQHFPDLLQKINSLDGSQNYNGSTLKGTLILFLCNLQSETPNWTGKHQDIATNFADVVGKRRYKLLMLITRFGYGKQTSTSTITQTTRSLMKDLSPPPICGRSLCFLLLPHPTSSSAPNQSLSVLYHYFVKTRNSAGPTHQ